MSTQNDLEELYRSATYVVHHAGGDIVIRLGRENSELASLLTELGGKTWAFLTAYNPNSQPTDQELNEKSQVRLVDLLDSMGLRYLEGYGTGEDWEAEPSLFILDIDRPGAIQLGRDFGQSALLFGELGSGAELVWCDRG